MQFCVLCDPELLTFAAERERRVSDVCQGLPREGVRQFRVNSKLIAHFDVHSNKKGSER